MKCYALHLEDSDTFTDDAYKLLAENTISDMSNFSAKDIPTLIDDMRKRVTTLESTVSGTISADLFFDALNNYKLRVSTCRKK